MPRRLGGYARDLNPEADPYAGFNAPRTGTCTFAFDSLSSGTEVASIRLESSGSSVGEGIETVPGSTITLDMAEVSDTFFAVRVNAMLRVNNSDDLPQPWTGAVQDNQPVWLDNEFVRVQCDGGIDEVGNTRFSLLAGTECTITPVEEGGEVALMRADLRFEATPGPVNFTADPQDGPIAIYGTDDPERFPVRRAQPD